MFEEIKNHLKGKSSKAITLYLKSIDLTEVINYLSNNSVYNDLSKSRKFYLIKDFLTEKYNTCPICHKIIEQSRHHCSMKCRDLDPETQKRKNETQLKHFGRTHFNNREKAKKTVQERYHVDHTSQLKEVREKIEQTMLRKFGVKCNLQSEETREKIRKTNLKKYHVAVASKSDIVKEKAKETCLKKYNAESFAGSEYGRNKIKNTFLERYGVDSPMKVKEFCIKNHETRRKNNIKNYDLFNNKEYIRENLFLNDKTPNSKAIQEFFGISQPYCSWYLRKLFGSEIEYPTSQSESEIELQSYVKSICPNVRTNDRTIINPLELDIVLPKIKLAIEYDGSYWHSSELKDSNYHLRKTESCEEKGYQLFHIFEFDDIDIWKSMISNKLHLNSVIYARKCTIKELKYSQIKDFLNENHLQGACISKINLGLFYNDELVEVMTFGKPRFNKNYDYELLRLCSKKFTNVVGGASKLFKYFISKYKGSIISYANRRFSNGSIYRILGFKEVKNTPPNYFYVKNESVLTRYQCQKHKLEELYNKGILKEYDSVLTESENMKNNGYFKIYDSGNLVFTY